MGHVAFVASVEDAAHHSIPLNFLPLIKFVPSRYATRMEVTNPLAVRSYGGDQIPFHDLHMVDVVEQLDAR